MNQTLSEMAGQCPTKRPAPITECISGIHGLVKETDSAIKELFKKLSPILSCEPPPNEKTVRTKTGCELEIQLRAIFDICQNNLLRIYDIKERLRI